MYVCMYVCMTYFITRLALKYTGRRHGGKVQPFPGLKKKTNNKPSLLVSSN